MSRLTERTRVADRLFSGGCIWVKLRSVCLVLVVSLIMILVASSSWATPSVSAQSGSPGQDRRFPTRAQIEELRRRASDRLPYIMNVTFGDCVRGGSTISVSGRNFGTAAGRNLIIIRRVELAALQISSWSNTLITAKVPISVAARDSYDIAFKDGAGEWISNLKRVKGCALEPGRLPIVTGTVPVPETCTPVDLDLIDRVCENNVGCKIVQGDQVLLDFYGGRTGSAGWTDSQNAFELILSYWLTFRCTGPVEPARVVGGRIVRPARAVEYWLDASGRPPLGVTWACSHDRARSPDDLQVNANASGAWEIVRTELVGPRRLTRGILYAFSTERDAHWMLDILRRHSGVARCSLGAQDVNHRMDFFGR